MKTFWCLLVMVNVSMRTTVTPCDAQCQELIKKNDGAKRDILEMKVPVVENTKADAPDKDSKDLVTKSTTSQPYRNVTDNNRSLCDGARVTSVYERDRDIDIKYVLDSITALWRITFCLIFTLVLVVFLISYVSSLIRKSGEKKYSPAVKKHANRGMHLYICRLMRLLTGLI